MDIYVVILRLIHIFSGIFWVGTSFFTLFFLQPSVRAAGPAGGAVMGRLSSSRFPMAIGMAALFTVAAGFLLYWKDSGGFQANFITSPAGIMLTLGALGGISAFVVSFSVQMPTTLRMAAIQKEVQASGQPPTPAHMQELQVLQKRMEVSTQWGVIFMIIAVIGMATARELGNF
jgi:uncharacterized membrane protein